MRIRQRRLKPEIPHITIMRLSQRSNSSSVIVCFIFLLLPALVVQVNVYILGAVLRLHELLVILLYDLLTVRADHFRFRLLSSLHPVAVITDVGDGVGVVVTVGVSVGVGSGVRVSVGGSAGSVTTG